MNRPGTASRRLLFASLTLVAILAWHVDAIAAQLTLTWSDTSADEVSFAIERSVGSEGPFVDVATTGPRIMTYIDSDVAAGTTYCYRVRAFDDTDYSDYSDMACGTAAPPFSLTVVKGGAGSGTVTSTPAGIACGSSCSGSYPSGTAVTLTASPNASSTFTGWSGGCSGTGTCAITVTTPTSVMATFAVSVVTATVSKAGSGGGTVTSAPAGISCGATCSGNFPKGTAVTFTASPAAGSVFTGWSGAGCSGPGACTITMTAAANITATFGLQPVTVTLIVGKGGTGSGSVTSSPTGIGCGGSCSSIYPKGTVVTLTAAPASGSSFTGWSGGGCSGTGTCTVNVTLATTTVTASFAAQTATLTVALLGSGNGTVTSTPSGIACGATCVWTYPSGTPVTLLATPGSGSSFAGWGGGGGCTGAGVCTTTLAGATSVNATFNLAPPPSFSDTFQRADSTVLGMGWTEPQGDFFIRDGSLWNGTEKTRHLAVQTPPTMATGKVTAGFTSLNNNAAPAFGLVFGFVDARNYYAAYRQVGGSAVLKIVRVTNGVETVLAQRSCANPVRGSKFDLAVSVFSSQVVLTGAGQTLTATGISVTPAKVGVMVAGGGTSHMVDNFQVAP